VTTDQRGEGRVHSLATTAVESEVSKSYLFSFIFYVSFMGAFGMNGYVMGLHQPQENITLVTSSVGI
jgi:hypothetical protein